MSSVAVRPDVKGTVAQVMSGELFTGLSVEETEQRGVALEALLGKVVDRDTRVVWVGNPLRSPLTIERFLIQTIGPEIDLREERGPAELAKLIAKPVGHESRLLIVVQQPETIDAEMRELLVGMGSYLGGEAVQVQFLFSGSPAFAVPQLPPPAFMTFPSQVQAAEPADIERVPTAPRRRDVLPLIVLLLTLTIGVVISLAPTSPDSMLTATTVAAPPVPEIPSAPAVPPPAPAPEALPAPPPHSPDVLILRQQFDGFLAQRTPALPPMTESEKSALFGEFLTHHRRE